MTQAFGPGLLDEWLIEKDLTFLNHGSYGAVPRVVLSAQNHWRDQLERQPVRFFNETLASALSDAAQSLAGFVGAPPASLVFVTNATEGINAVSRSLRLGSGDEILTTDQDYQGVVNSLHYECVRSGAALKTVSLPWPTVDESQIVNAVKSSLGPRVRLAVFDHVTSHGAIVMPIRQLVDMCDERGIPVLVDGAHAPGMVALDISQVGANWYVGNCHKWLCAPKGCAMLSVSDCMQADLHPTVISTGYNEGFWEEFSWTGTRDPSAWLSVTAAIKFWEGLGVQAARAYMHNLANWAGDELAARWGTERGASSQLTGSMVTVRVPGARQVSHAAAVRLHDQLLHQHRIEVLVVPIDGALWVRISTQVYNGESDIDRLAAALS